MKDQYPTYSSSTTYNLGNIVYGGFAGHALYRKTAALAGGPVFTNATNAQDICGWTRCRPATRQIAPDKTLSISFKLKLDKGSFPAGPSNGVRIGLFKSVGSYINDDSHGLTNALFNGYSGYMFGYGPSNIKINKRTGTTDLALISTTSGSVYTELVSNSVSGFGGTGITEYEVSIKLKNIGGGLEITNAIYGPEYSSKFTHIDSTPVLSFDTLVFYTTSSNVASITLSSPLATYDGETQALPTGIGSDDPANAAEPDATAYVLMDGPFYNNPGNPASGFVGNQSWRKMQPGAAVNGRPSYFYGMELVSWTGSQWQYESPGYRVFSTSSSNVAYPWLATAWTNNYSAAKVTSTYTKLTQYPAVP